MRTQIGAFSLGWGLSKSVPEGGSREIGPGTSLENGVKNSKSVPEQFQTGNQFGMNKSFRMWVPSISVPAWKTGTTSGTSVDLSFQSGSRSHSLRMERNLGNRRFFDEPLRPRSIVSSRASRADCEPIVSGIPLMFRFFIAKETIFGPKQPQHTYFHILGAVTNARDTSRPRRCP